MSSSDTQKLPKDLTFEDALDELEEITRRLEAGEDSLDDSMALYEKGILLKSFCEGKLKEAEGKWKVLRKDNGGGVSEKEIPSDRIPEAGELGGDQDSMF